MNLNEIYPSKYLRGADLGGRSALVKIERVTLEEFYDLEQRAEVRKPVLYLEGKKKAVILSKSLAYSIAGILGSENLEDWKGKTFVLYSERKLVYGNQKDVLCARALAAEE